MEPETEISLSNQIREAAFLHRKACYKSLLKAAQIYEKLYSVERLRPKLVEAYLRTLLFLSLRRKELGICRPLFLKKAKELVEAHPELQEKYVLLLQAIEMIGTKYKSVVEDVDDRKISIEFFRKSMELKKRIKELRLQDDLFSYVFISYSYSSYFEKREDLEEIFNVFRSSPFIRFKKAVLTKDQKALLELLEDAECKEAAFFLGEFYFEKHLLFKAERYYSEAAEAFPESIAALYSLASLYFLLEEYESSLIFYQKILNLVPKNQNAILGKGVCLSLLGKHHEAIKTLKHLLSFGKWYPGEIYYWLAWNQRQLNLMKEALNNVQKAKSFLIGNSSVLSLSGMICFHMKLFDQAEKDFKQALKLNPSDCEAAFYLGLIKDKIKQWEKAVSLFEKAFHCYSRKEKKLMDKKARVENYKVEEKRKEKLIAKIEAKLKRIKLAKAITTFNVATAYFPARKTGKCSKVRRKGSTSPPSETQSRATPKATRKEMIIFDKAFSYAPPLPEVIRVLHYRRK